MMISFIKGVTKWKKQLSRGVKWTICLAVSAVTFGILLEVVIHLVEDGQMDVSLENRRTADRKTNTERFNFKMMFSLLLK